MLSSWRKQPRWSASRLAGRRNGTKANVGENYEHNLQVGDDRRTRVFRIRIRHDGRIFGAGWTDRSPRPLLHDLGHWRLRLQLYELCPVPSDCVRPRCGVLRQASMRSVTVRLFAMTKIRKAKAVVAIIREPRPANAQPVRTGRSGHQANPLVPLHCRMRAFDRAPIHGVHYRGYVNRAKGPRHGCTDQPAMWRKSLPTRSPHMGLSRHGVAPNVRFAPTS